MSTSFGQKSGDSGSFLSPAPGVTLTGTFPRPFENAVATARTCYSPKGIITEKEVSGDSLPDADKQEARRARRDRLAQDIYKAGHHTTLQHAHFQFALSNVSRQFLWSFLHSHPYYNSEQVSQRYVEVAAGMAAIPPLAGEALADYEGTLSFLFDAYRRLDEALREPVTEAYYSVFPARRSHSDRWSGSIKKKTQELARYVLPVATFAYLYHTVSGLTLLRYWRLAEAGDCPLEQRIVLRKMVEAVLDHDPLYKVILEEPLPLEETPEARYFSSAEKPDAAASQVFRSEFDRDLSGRTSKLVSFKGNAELLVADAVREVLGLPKSALSDDDAISLAVDPARNPMLRETLNLTSHDKLSRALVHPSYTFKKKLSHTADSQDQRHRTTPASRPYLTAYLTEDPDVVVPPLVAAHPPAKKIFDEAVERAWEGARRVLARSGSQEYASYLLPNATSIRFTESADLLGLRHKLAMRLCYNSQEEIWRASVDEAEQVRAIEPRLGKWLLPPCGVRVRAKTKPICPEGERFCGVTVWRLDSADWKRQI